MVVPKGHLHGFLKELRAQERVSAVDMGTKFGASKGLDGRCGRGKKGPAGPSGNAEQA